MKRTLNADFVERTSRLLGSDTSGDTSVNIRACGQPIHVVYGGADLFKAETCQKLGRLALRSLEQYAATPESFAQSFGIMSQYAGGVRESVLTKLEFEPIEDYRIDFEDGYGIRPDAEEDLDAERTAAETAAAMRDDMLPRYFGIRSKAFTPQAAERAIGTIDIFLTRLVESAGRVPDNFAVTLPKVDSAVQVEALAGTLDKLEASLGIESGSIRIELMVETPRAVIGPFGEIALPSLIAASRGRCRSAHFGAYDYLSSLGVTSSSQSLDHQACDLARGLMQSALSDTGVWISDGATIAMPVGPHREKELTQSQLAENRQAVMSAWQMHASNCRRALRSGIYQGWDLHPAQIPARLAAVYAFFAENLDDASLRLKSFVDKATKASLVGNTFDDAATGQGLLNFFLRAISCSAVTEEDAAARTGVTLDEFQQGSFEKIVAART